MNYRAPAFVLEEDRLIKNLELLSQVQSEAEVSIILALKAYALWQTFPLIGKYLSGATASSLNEAKLIHEEMGRKAHTYSPGYSPDDFEGLIPLSSHLTFNSLSQYAFYKNQIAQYHEVVSFGIRVNPEYSEVETELYNPCAPGSRLGVTAEQFGGVLPNYIEGLHFHTLCESTSYDLEKTLVAFEEKFGHFLPQLKWVNFGGGHLMTRSDYDTNHLIQVLKSFKSKYPNLNIILEPGSAIGWQTGYLRSTVLDIVENQGIQTLILDVSFTAHMPDTLEMPYRPTIRGASAQVKEDLPTYRIGGVSCLSGDFMYEYSFEKPVQIGDEIIFEDMLHYTLVKTTMFNGVRHPDIILKKSNTEKLLRRFSYEDYKSRMG